MPAPLHYQTLSVEVFETEAFRVRKWFKILWQPAQVHVESQIDSLL